MTANNSHTPISKPSRKSVAFLDGCPENKMTPASPFIKVKVNPEHLETREVFYTRAQDGFSLKSKSKKRPGEFQQPITPVKKARPSMHAKELFPGRRLFAAEDDNTKSG